MKSYTHNFTWNLFELHNNLLLTTYKLHMKFMWTSYEFHMKWDWIYAYGIHEKFIWTSYGVQMNFSWISYEMKSNLFIWIYMQFVIEGPKEVNMLYLCNTDEVNMRLMNKKYVWSSYEFLIIWTSC